MPIRRTQNYDGKAFFGEVLRICERRGDEIQAGFEGGETALRTAVLQNRVQYLKDRE